jgi:diacylglycerol kinase family enzyme
VTSVRGTDGAGRGSEDDVTAGDTARADRVTAGTRRSRSVWLARLALVAAAAAVGVLLVAAGVRSGIALLLVGAAGAVVTLAAGWWFLSRRGVVRWLSAGVAVAAPIVVVLLYVRAGLLWVVLVTAALWAGAVAAGRAADDDAAREQGPVELETPPPRQPFLIMNPRSGGGKVGKFDLARKARDLGAEVVLLDGAAMDVAGLARSAIGRGADLLGVAGGDGTQALVAGVAAEHDIPFMVLSAGTRNHFALDLGLDREDPSTGLDALTDGVEIRVDLGLIGDRTFVNNASFGAYAAIVQSPAYRDDKVRTTLDLLPEFLDRQAGPVLRVRADALRLKAPKALLVSNNPYGADDVAGLGRRPRLDGGRLGVLALTVDGARDAAGLARGLRARAVWQGSCDQVLVDADAPGVAVGVDGEALTLPAPVRCAIRPAALRVRVPRSRPGVPAARRRPPWSRLVRLAVSSARSDEV